MTDLLGDEEQKQGKARDRYHGLPKRLHKAFDILIERHPCRTGDRKAIANALKKINPDEQFLKEILLAHEAQCKYWRETKQDVHFIKGLAPWLNQGCYDDQIGSHAEARMNSAKEVPCCKCNEPATNQGKGDWYCAGCYVDTFDDWKVDLRESFKANNLYKKTDETKAEYVQRMRQICFEKIGYLP